MQPVREKTIKADVIMSHTLFFDRGMQSRNDSSAIKRNRFPVAAGKLQDVENAHGASSKVTSKFLLFLITLLIVSVSKLESPIIRTKIECFPATWESYSDRR